MLKIWKRSLQDRGDPARYSRTRLYSGPFLVWPEGSGVQTKPTPAWITFSIAHGEGMVWWLLVYSMCDCWWECYWSNIGGNLKVATWSENPFLTLQRSMYILQDTIIKPLSLHSQWSVAIMTTLRPFCCEDLFKYNNVNLDPLTETYNLAFYLMYLSR